ncbi:MAG: RNA polymerase sigma factor [Thermoanaerobaculia bacterium]
MSGSSGRSHGPPTLKDLVSRVQGRDAVAFKALLEMLNPRLDMLCREQMWRPLKDGQETSDMLQEIYLKLWESIGGFQWMGAGRFIRWVTVLARNVIVNGGRRPKPPRPIGTVDAERQNGGKGAFLLPLIQGVVSPEYALRRRERLHRLREALKKLKPGRRDVVVQVFLMKRPIKEIAAEMRRTPGAVSVQLFRALRQLRHLFGSTSSFRLPSGPLLEPPAGGRGRTAGEDGGARTAGGTAREPGSE